MEKICMDFHGDHTSTCTAHSGGTKAHDWMVSVLGPLFRTAGHTDMKQQNAPSRRVRGPDLAQWPGRQQRACRKAGQFSPLALKYWTPVSRVPPRRAASRFRPV
jgi:hypothetical protein